tara:strand:+ start:1150 stop:2442 length:1293 start_codon:yes stop_codon:yes gene_type:complete
MILQIKIIFSILLFITGYYFFISGYEGIEIFNNQITNTTNEPKIENEFNISKNEYFKIDDLAETINTNNNLNEIVITIKKNETFISIFDDFFSSRKKIYKVIDEINRKFNLKKLKTGQEIFVYQNKLSNDLEKIIIPIEDKIDLVIFISENIKVEENHLDVEIENYSKEFKITNSLFKDGINNEIPADILIKIIKLYSFDLDFQRDIRKDTKVSVSYQKIFIENRNKDYFGDINYASIEIENNKLEYFKFKTEDGFTDYFNRKGENVKKSLLKTPLDGAKLSSGFGMRKHPILGYNKMHKGVDFAAPKGTPVFAGGNGVIEFAGRNGAYGNYIRIRHNNEYKTAYAHLSSFKKGIATGTRVNQRDIIGYVGSTGRSTGPHLHYEIIFQNKQINPLKLKLPSGKKLKGEEFEKFISEMKIIYANHLNLLFE